MCSTARTKNKGLNRDKYNETLRCREPKRKVVVFRLLKEWAIFAGSTTTDRKATDR